LKGNNINDTININENTGVNIIPKMIPKIETYPFIFIEINNVDK